MKAPVLVVTPHAPFGELLRISLEDSGQYRVRLVQSGRAARDAAANVSFHLAIIDSALTDEPFVPLCTDLLQAQPGLRLMVIPPENNPNHPALGGLMPHGYLSRPFYLPDLIQTAARLIEEREKAGRIQGAPQAAAPSDTLPPWLQEPMTLTMYLEKELAGTQALAAIIGLANEPGERGGRLRASAGIFTGQAVQELADAVFRYWNTAEKTDLMRYLRMETDKREYLVYATRLIGSLVLILAYDSASPLSQIRPRTRAVAHTLATVPPDDIRGAKPALPPAALHPSEAARPAAVITPSTELEFPPYPGGEFEEDLYAESPLINLSELLGSVPPPDPTAAAAENEGETGAPWFMPQPVPEQIEAWQPDPPAAVSPAAPGEFLPAETPAARAPTAEPVPAAQPVDIFRAASKMLAGVPSPARPGAAPAVSRPVLQAAEPAAEIAPAARPAPLEVKEPPVRSLGDTAPIAALARGRAGQSEDPGATLPTPSTAHAVVEPPVDPLEDTRPGAITAMRQAGVFEPPSPALSLLNYTCVLMPRSPHQYLIGELADKLALWVAQVCMAFGWRLEGIAVRPEYLQWSVKVAPAVSPGNLVRILRQRTSLNIFTTFEALAPPNPNADFWAPGYLIVSGAQPPSAQLLRDYIAQTRRRTAK